MIHVIKNYGVPEIKQSILYLLDKAAKSYEVRQHALEITADHQDKIGAVYDWVKRTISYVPDPIGANGNEIELFISPVRMVDDFNRGLKPGGDCDDHALLSTALYRALGIQSNVVLMNSTGMGLDHAYCKVYSEILGRWITADTTGNVPLGWEYPSTQEITV